MDVGIYLVIVMAAFVLRIPVMGTLRKVGFNI